MVLRGGGGFRFHSTVQHIWAARTELEFPRLRRHSLNKITYVYMHLHDTLVAQEDLRFVCRRQTLHPKLPFYTKHACTHSQPPHTLHKESNNSSFKPCEHGLLYHALLHTVMPLPHKHTKRTHKLKHHFFPGTAVLNAAGTRLFHWHGTWKENLNVFLLISPPFHSETRSDLVERGGVKDCATCAAGVGKRGDNLSVGVKVGEERLRDRVS